MRLILLLLDKIFPRRPDYVLVQSVEPADIEKLYQPHKTGDIVALASFKEPVIRACIHEAKFHHNEKAIALLATLISSYLSESDATSKIIPIPLSAKRQRKRGYNQVVAVIRKSGPHQLCTDVLIRTRDTTPQTKLNRSDRLQNLDDAFFVPAHQSHHINDAHILLVDDVTTTSATLRAAKEALEKHQPASITCVALAH